MFLYYLAKKYFPHLGERPVTERDVRRVAKRVGVEIVEGDVGVPGMYLPYGWAFFIVIHPGLTGVMRLWVLMHELSHHLLHDTGMQLFDSRFRTKADHQANFISALSLLPLLTIQTKTFAELLEEGYPRELLWRRKEIYEQFKI